MLYEVITGRIAVKIPSGVQSGSRIRVAGKGYPFRAGERGDLYITVRIVNPAYLTAEQKTLYEKLVITSYSIHYTKLYEDLSKLDAVKRAMAGEAYGYAFEKDKYGEMSIIGYAHSHGCNAYKGKDWSVIVLEQI